MSRGLDQLARAWREAVLSGGGVWPGALFLVAGRRRVAERSPERAVTGARTVAFSQGQFGGDCVLFCLVLFLCSPGWP